MALAPPPEKATVSVVVRVRPPTLCERAVRPVLKVIDEHLLIFNPEEAGGTPGSGRPPCGPKSQGKAVQFVFDRVLGMEARQEEVFQHSTLGLLDYVLEGYNCSVFAYGATGAGKTFTMLGSAQSPGIMCLTVMELYKQIEARRAEKSCEVSVSYLEVYNEQIHDLLEPKGSLALWEDPEKGAVVQGLSLHQPSSAEELLEMLAKGNKNRSQHPTDANASSSRSHAVFQIHVKQQDSAASLTCTVQEAKLSLIDLAGSERATVANTKGQHLWEGANINRSLLALMSVINALADTKSKKSHVPYRDSKLTRLLKDSLGGNCRTVMIAAVSPSVLAYEDTYNTLKYASRAKEIRQSLKRNVGSVESHWSKYPVLCEQLRAEVAALQEKLRAYEEAAAPLAALSPSPGELPRVEEAAAAEKVSAGKQQELEAVSMQLELEKEAPVGFTCSSPTPTKPCQEKKRPTLLLQESGSHRDTLLTSILAVARRQFCLLKEAQLLIPTMISDFEEMERLVQEAGVSVEVPAASAAPAVELSRASLAQRTQQGCEAEMSVAVAAALQGQQQLPLLASPTLLALSPINRRQRSPELSGASQAASPHSLPEQKSHQQSHLTGAEAALNLSSSCLPSAAPAPNDICHRPPSPVHQLNVTYDVWPSEHSPSQSQAAACNSSGLSIQEGTGKPLKKPDAPFVPKSRVPVSAARASSIPRASTVSRPSVLKRKRVESSTCLSQAWPSKRLELQLPSSSRSLVLPSCNPAAPSRPLTRTKRRTKLHPPVGSTPSAPPAGPTRVVC